MVITHEGYAIPLHVRDRLYYMDMKAAFDDELDTLPHVFLTVDAPWNPSIMDEEFFVDHQDSVLDIPAIQQCHEGRDPMLIPLVLCIPSLLPLLIHLL